MRVRRGEPLRATTLRRPAPSDGSRRGDEAIPLRRDGQVAVGVGGADRQIDREDDGAFDADGFHRATERGAGVRRAHAVLGQRTDGQVVAHRFHRRAVEVRVHVRVEIDRRFRIQVEFTDGLGFEIDLTGRHVGQRQMGMHIGDGPKGVGDTDRSIGFAAKVGTIGQAHSRHGVPIVGHCDTGCHINISVVLFLPMRRRCVLEGIRCSAEGVPCLPP